MALFPHAWLMLFSTKPEVLAAGSIVSAAIVAGALWLRGWSPAGQVSK